MLLSTGELYNYLNYAYKKRNIMISLTTTHTNHCQVFLLVIIKFKLMMWLLGVLFTTVARRRHAAASCYTQLLRRGYKLDEAAARLSTGRQASLHCDQINAPSEIDLASSSKPWPRR
jgi:hypothetical protein